MTTHPYLDHGVSILQARLSPSTAHPFSTCGAAVHPFVTISHECCAGATTLGRDLAPLLEEQTEGEDRSWMFLDKDLITHALTRQQLPERLAEYLPEDRVPEIKAMIGEFIGLHPPLWEVERHVSNAILQIARLGRVILAGRAAHLITRKLTCGFHLRLVASLETRIRRMRARRNCDETAATSAVRDTDAARRRYVQTFFDQDIDDARAYDLVINTDHVAPATAARLVLRALQDRAAAPAAAGALG